MQYKILCHKICKKRVFKHILIWSFALFVSKEIVFACFCLSSKGKQLEGVRAF